MTCCTSTHEKLSFHQLLISFKWDDQQRVPPTLEYLFITIS